MNWKCPTCNRSFKNVNQWHSCAVHKIEDHFNRTSEQIIETFKEIESFTKALGPNIEMDVVKTMICFKHGSNFMTVNFKKDSLHLHISMKESHDEFPVYKIMNWGKKYHHSIALECKNEFDAQIKNWIRAAYELSH